MSTHRKLASPHRDLMSPHRDLDVQPFFYFGLHLISGKKHFNFSAKTFFFGLYSIAGTELLHFLLSLVKAAKASPHAKIYKLSTGYHRMLLNVREARNLLTLADLSFHIDLFWCFMCSRFKCF